ncbi:MAG: hypothetical protein SOX22_03695 [Bacteroidaceae bacterium]|nr:hypothetical protein [Bacteroidaceae bacterium]
MDLGSYLTQIGAQKLTSVRDLWRQKDLDTARLKYHVPTHGVKYLKVRF